MMHYHAMNLDEHGEMQPVYLVRGLALEKGQLVQLRIGAANIDSLYRVIDLVQQEDGSVLVSLENVQRGG